MSPSSPAALPAVALAALFVVACAPARTISVSPDALPPAGRVASASAVEPARVPGDPTFSKRLEFAILEDYDKGADLSDIARDFQLFRELGITTWRGSFGWDDYEPTRGRYDFAWLHQFTALAAQHGLTLRPYLGYTPEWAAAGRRADGSVWNDPPARQAEFARFAGRIAAALQRHGNVPSYEIYNEQNTKMWWDGTVEEYADVFTAAADSIRAAAPGAAVILGGLVWADADWAEAVCALPVRPARVDAVPVHIYSETWTPDSVTLERTVADLGNPSFREVVDGACGGAPVWANEIGFATARGKTERQQADWWVRAIAALAADRRVSLVGVYEIKDLTPGSAVIGEAENFHLGLTRPDRTKKLAFHTVKLLVGVLGREFTVADAELRLAARQPNAALPDAHLFRRPDGQQVLVAWARQGRPGVTVDVTLPRCGAAAASYALDGTGTPLPLDGGRHLRGLQVSPGAPRIVVVTPGSGCR